MRLAPIALALTAILLVTACSDSDEDIIIENVGHMLPSPTPVDAIIFCPRVGDGALPSTPSPVPSCDAPTGSYNPDLPDLRGDYAEPPAPFPDGTSAISGFFQFSGHTDEQASLAIPLTETTPNETVAGWYTYDDDEWKRVTDASINRGNPSFPNGFANDAFDAVP